jgi:hypothetical protein
MTDAEKTPPPGSPKAIGRGCTCPAWENGWGAGRADGSFYIKGGCPLHCRPAWTAEEQEKWKA